MKINGIQNQTIRNTSFKGIRLSKTDYGEVRTLAFILKNKGSDLLGKKRIYCSNSLSDVINAAKDIRRSSPFYGKEFGVAFFPWRGEVYIMASHNYEQKLYKQVKIYDEGAVLNLGI